MGYMGICGPKGFAFSAALFMKGVSILADFGRFSHKFAFVTRRPYRPGRPKKLCFTTLSPAPTVLAARLSLVKQSFFGLPGQYGCRVTKANRVRLLHFSHLIIIEKKINKSPSQVMVI